MSEDSDERLLKDYLRGDRGAFDELFRRHSRRVFATAFRLTADWEDAEDALQETFVRLAAKAGTIRDAGCLSTWLYRTAVNCATECLRRRKNREKTSLDASPETGARVVAVESIRRESDREEAARGEELLSRVEALVPRLPEKQAAVFVLRAFQGLSHKRVAEAVGCTEATARSHYSLACSRLREWVEAAMRAEERGGRAPGATNPERSSGSEGSR